MVDSGLLGLEGQRDRFWNSVESRA